LSPVRDEYVPAERRDAERRISGAELLVDEAARRAHSTPMGVVDEHAPVVEVRGIQMTAHEREPAEDGSGARGVDRDLRLLRPAVRDARRPAADAPVLARVQEPCRRGPAARADDEPGAAVVDDAGRPAWDGHRQRLLAS